jgi:hypothetical protein
MFRPGPPVLSDTCSTLDLPAEQCDPAAVRLGPVQQLEGVPGGAGRAAEDADHHGRVVLGELGERVRAVVGHPQEQRAVARVR